MANEKRTVDKSSGAASPRIVLVRSRDSGVWMGEFAGSPSPESVALRGGRKIWRWRGANTTSELALHGCTVEYSRVAEPVDVTITGACELIECSPEAWAAVRRCGWAE